MYSSISNDIVSTKIYDKSDDFDFEIVNCPFVIGDVPRSTSYGVNISQLIRFARASSHVADFNTCSKLLTQKLLKQGYRYHKTTLRVDCKMHYSLEDYSTTRYHRTLVYGDAVYKFNRIVGKPNFNDQ